jgi:hypothetical protein
MSDVKTLTRYLSQLFEDVYSSYAVRNEVTICSSQPWSPTYTTIIPNIDSLPSDNSNNIHLYVGSPPQEDDA